jgi:hypothetical protein
MAFGASLDEVWSSSAQSQLRDVRAPGGGGGAGGGASSKHRSKHRSQRQAQQRQAQQQQQQQRQPMPMPLPMQQRGAPSRTKPSREGFSGLAPEQASAEPTGAGDADPLCELYSMGYTPSLDAAFEARADVRLPSGAYGSVASDAAMQACMSFPSSQGADAGWGGQAPLDFYDLSDDFRGDDDDAAPLPPPRPPARPPQPQGQADGQQDDDTDDDEDPEARRQARRPAARRRDESGSDGPSVAAFAMDMSLYVVSGVILIFLLEQFIQIGTRVAV